MARSRVYRHGPDVRCPDCGSNWMRRDGFTNGKQAYGCGDCRRRYVPAGRLSASGRSGQGAGHCHVHRREQFERHRTGVGPQRGGGAGLGGKGGRQALNQLRRLCTSGNSFYDANPVGRRRCYGSVPGSPRREVSRLRQLDASGRLHQRQTGLRLRRLPTATFPWAPIGVRALRSRSGALPCTPTGAV